MKVILSLLGGGVQLWAKRVLALHFGSVHGWEEVVARAPLREYKWGARGATSACWFQSTAGECNPWKPSEQYTYTTVSPGNDTPSTTPRLHFAETAATIVRVDTG